MNSDYIIYSNSRAIPSKDGPGMSACAAHRLLQSLPDLGGNGANIIPVTAAGDLESVVLREARAFLTMYIRYPLEEEQWKDVCLEVGRIHRPPEDVGRFP